MSQAPQADQSGPNGQFPDLPALETVYREHYAFVWRNARRLGCDASTLDDVVHEVFLVVARRLHEFRGESHVRSWLFAITYHVLQRLRRDHARYTRRLQEYGSLHQALGPEGDSEPAGEELRRLLAKLDEPKRLVFILAELEGMTSAEIARCLQMKVGTVDSRLRLARLELKDLLERERVRTRRFWP